MYTLANISLFTNLVKQNPICMTFNDDSINEDTTPHHQPPTPSAELRDDDFEKRLERLDRESRAWKRGNRWRNALIGTLISAAGLGGVGAGLDYMGGHKDLPLQLTPGLERAADTVHQGLNIARGSVDSSKMSDLEKTLETERLLHAFDRGERWRQERKNARLTKELNDTKIAKDNWKQGALHRGDEDFSEAPSFGQLFKEKGTDRPIKGVPVSPFALGGGLAGLSGSGALLARLLRKTKNKK